MTEDPANVRAAALKIQRMLKRHLNKTADDWAGLFFGTYYSDLACQWALYEFARRGDKESRKVIEFIIRHHVVLNPSKQLPEPLRSYAYYKLAQELPPVKRGPGVLSNWPLMITVCGAVIVGMDHGLPRTRTRNKHGGPRLSACALAHRELAKVNIRLKETSIERMTDHFGKETSVEWVKARARFKAHSPPVLNKRTRGMRQHS